MVYFAIGFAIFVADLLTKILAKTHLSELGSVPLLEGVFHLTYVENRGAAFGMMQGRGLFFVVVALLFVAVAIWVSVKIKNKPPLLNLGISFMTAGALGNMVDRILSGYVVDFFDFALINFPVFNVADIFVCLGAGALAVFFVFFEEKWRKEQKGEKDSD
ncbi:MAG: signal peptidase II [Clostridia bacterium]|nr:signal peptidase II [Clostridia bacterium]